MAHRIRLRAPWAVRREPGRLVWLRRFHRPTGLDAKTRVYLVLEGLSTTVEATLNAAPLGQAAAAEAEFDLTGLLEPYNALAVATAGDPPQALPTEPPFQARLEIRGPSDRPPTSGPSPTGR